MPYMTREALAKELYDLEVRYRDSTIALEVFVRDSLEGIEHNRAVMLGLMEKARTILRGEEPVIEPRPGNVTIGLKSEELEFLADLASDQSRYYEMHPQMLLEMSLTYAGALFDAVISDALLAALRHIPERLRSGRTLTVEDALRFQDRDELIENLAYREMRDLMYQSVEKQFAYFRTSFGVDVFEDTSLVVSVAAVRERRNLVAHNNGLASDEYVARFDSTAKVGDRVVTDAESAESDRVLLAEVAVALVSRLRDKLAPSD
jgi:uncharacterized protein (UPF0216 family)